MSYQKYLNSKPYEAEILKIVSLSPNKVHECVLKKKDGWFFKMHKIILISVPISVISMQFSKYSPVAYLNNACLCINK